MLPAVRGEMVAKVDAGVGNEQAMLAKTVSAKSLDNIVNRFWRGGSSDRSMVENMQRRVGVMIDISGTKALSLLVWGLAGS